MKKNKEQEIVKWMCKHWQSEDVFDDAVQKFGKSKEVISFCEQVARKMEKALKGLPSYLEREISWKKIKN